ncbi:MAG: hypothetical protein VX915_01415, partial [Pseudomonadota bacterium]|nr:hypothetical protein [Pseudomonadota bacterium]
NSRMNRLFETVVNDGLHLLMTSQLNGPVDHYGKLFLNRLKMRSGLAVETFMPVSTDALIARFNSMLGDVSVEEARDDKAPMPGRVIVVNDLRAIDGENLSLLMRLISDFPSLNVRLVFLADQIPKDMERILERLGSRLVRWDVVPPSPDEQMKLRKESMQIGLEFQVERVLTRINQSVADQLEPSLDFDDGQPSLQLDANRALESGTEAGEREAEDMKALFEEDEDPPRSKGRFRIVLILLVLCIIGFVGAATVNPDVGRQLNRLLVLIGVYESFFDRKEGERSVVDAAYDSESVKIPVETNIQPLLGDSIEINQPTTTEPKVNDRLNVATEIAAAAITADMQEEALASEPTTNLAEISQSTDPLATNDESTQVANADGDQSPNSEEQVALADPVSDQVISDPSVPAPSSEDQNSPEAASNDAIQNPLVALIGNASPNSQFVQHIVLASAARAEEWLSTQNGLDRAIVVPVSINSTRRFAVVSGPFETRTEVRDYIQGMDQTADYWVRTARSLQRIALIGDE